jgi:hypothetical protein
LPRQHGARSPGQACEIRNGAPLPGSDSGEGARSKWREAAAGNGEGAYTDVRDRAGDGEPHRNAAARLLSPRPAPPPNADSVPTPVQHVRALRQLVRMAPTRSDPPPTIP